MANMIPISTVTVGSGGASTIEFNNIPQIYTDLKIVISTRTDRASTYDYLKMKFNSSATSYSEKNINGNGTAAASETNNSTTYGFIYVSDATNATTSTFANIEIYIPNYGGSNNKSYSADGVQENNNATALMALTAGLWSNTSPITSITFNPVNGTIFNQYSSATLYGIRKY